MPLWETKNNGNFRVVRLTRRFAFKTPRILEFNGLKAEWRQYGNLTSKPSIPWQLKAWFKLFRQNRQVNEEEARTYEEWQCKGARKIAGVGLCPILFHLPWGLLNVMPKAVPVPQNRISGSQDPWSNGVVSCEEMNAAASLMGRNSDTSKADTFGLVNGELVVVDYGWLQPSRV
jgi:hypothetical protein